MIARAEVCAGSQQDKQEANTAQKPREELSANRSHDASSFMMYP